MKFYVCSVRDIASHEYKSLTLEPTEYAALRAFESSVLTSSSRHEGLLWSHPSDFELHVLGEFDSAKGTLTPVTCYRLCSADDFIEKSVSTKEE